MDSIRQIIEDEGQNVKIDINLIKSIRDYNQAFMNKNEEHTQFFGNILTGVNVVRFMPSDRDTFFDTILDDFDESHAYNRVVRLPTLKPEWKRATDVMNLSCLWLCHKFMTATNLKDSDKQEGMRQILIALNNKFLTSLLSRYFPHQVNPQIAKAVVDKMTAKFLLKQEGSWQALISRRSTDIVKPSSPQYKAIKYFDDDKDIIVAVQDIQLRIRQMLKGIWKELDLVLKSNSKVNVNKNTVMLDGESVVRDVTRNESKYLRYLHTVTQDQSRFIKEELIEVIISVSPTMSPVAFREVLDYVQKNSANPRHKEIEKFMDEVVLHSIEYLRRNKENRRLINNVGDLAGRLRSVYTSSRSTDVSLIRMRKDGEKIIKKASKIKSDSMIASVRTGLFLYIVMRTYTMNHYG